MIAGFCIGWQLFDNYNHQVDPDEIDQVDITGEWKLPDAAGLQAVTATVTEDEIILLSPTAEVPIKLKYKTQRQGKWILITTLPDEAKTLGGDEVSLLVASEGPDKLKVLSVGFVREHFLIRQ